MGVCYVWQSVGCYFNFNQRFQRTYLLQQQQRSLQRSQPRRFRRTPTISVTNPPAAKDTTSLSITTESPTLTSVSRKPTSSLPGSWDGNDVAFGPDKLFVFVNDELVDLGFFEANIAESDKGNSNGIQWHHQITFFFGIHMLDSLPELIEYVNIMLDTRGML